MSYTKEELHELLLKQKSFFKEGKTLNVKYRIAQLKKLKKMIIDNEERLEKALFLDLGRCDTEAYFCDIGDTILEINENIKGLKKWSKPETHFSGLHCFPSIKTKVYKMPYGSCLIISPFNFPVLLSIGVLAACLAGGNTAVIKVSSKSENASKLLKEIVSKTFDEDYVSVIDGGHDIADYLLAEKFDKIFYTGSPNVAKHVMSEASKNLIPVALELGGETGNWCIIRKDADIIDAAKKVAFFKICNSGQICININQVAVASEIADEFVSELKKQIINQIGEDPINNPEYPKLISKKAFESCQNECDLYKDRIIFGGKGNIESQKFSPTIIYPVNINEPICNHELFNPLLPIIKYDDEKISELLDTISSREHGLALYLFTKNIKWAKKTMQQMQYGGGAINEVCLQIMVKGVPFNGTGHSGMGAYHGVWGFKEFTHPSTVLIGKRHFNLSLRLHPYNSKKKKLLKRFLK